MFSAVSFVWMYLVVPSSAIWMVYCAVVQSSATYVTYCFVMPSNSMRIIFQVVVQANVTDGASIILRSNVICIDIPACTAKCHADCISGCCTIQFCMDIYIVFVCLCSFTTRSVLSVLSLYRSVVARQVSLFSLCWPSQRCLTLGF